MTHEENSNRNWFFISLFSFLFLRTAIIYFLYLVTGGNEFTMDRWIFELGFDPLSVLTFSTDASNYSQPPLFPIILAPFAYLTTMLTGEFLAARISFTLIEFCGFLMLARYLFLSEEIDSREKKENSINFFFFPYWIHGRGSHENGRSDCYGFYNSRIIGNKKAIYKNGELFNFFRSYYRENPLWSGFSPFVYFI